MSGRIAYLGDTVQDNLLLYLDAAKKESYTTGSSIWYDISNNSNDGTINNSPVFSKENGGLLVFDGINDNILTSYNGIPPLLSIEYVVSFNNDIGTYVVVGKYGIEGDYWTGLLSNKITFSMNGSSMDTGENITINTFYHVVCVFNSSTRDLYVNGVLKNSQPLYGQKLISGNLTISIFVGTFFSPINLSYIKYYEKNLTSTEVLRNFNSMRRRYGI
jgi:hypothetical protein